MNGVFAMSLICSHLGAVGAGFSLGGLLFTSGGDGGAFYGLIGSCVVLFFSLVTASIQAPEPKP